MEMRLFLAYLDIGHKDPGGRWGNSQRTAPFKNRMAVSSGGWAAIRTIPSFTQFLAGVSP
jgi:hypothetical protein